MLLNIEQAAEAMRQGLVVAYPTEAVFGLGCDPQNAQAVASLWRLKQRPAAKGLVLLGAQWQHLLPYMAALSAQHEATLRASWPNAITWVVPASNDVPEWITGGRDSVALRWTKHVAAANLCHAFGGAIVSSSANLHTQPALLTAEDILSTFEGQAGFAGVCEGVLGGNDKATPICELLTGQWIRT